MEITTRPTLEFIDLEIDEIRTTVWRDDIKEIQNIIDNLFDVIEELTEGASINLTVEQFIKDRGYGHQDY